MDDSFQNGLTALAGGAQVGATQIGGRASGAPTLSRFTTVVTTGDSAVLPAATAGLRYKVINGSGNSMNVFSAVGADVINALSNATAFALGAGKTVEFLCAVNGIWNTFPLVP